MRFHPEAKTQIKSDRLSVGEELVFTSTQAIERRKTEGLGYRVQATALHTSYPATFSFLINSQYDLDGFVALISLNLEYQGDGFMDGASVRRETKNALDRVASRSSTCFSLECLGTEDLAYFMKRPYSHKSFNDIEHDPLCRIVILAG